LVVQHFYILNNICKRIFGVGFDSKATQANSKNYYLGYD
jgi:hypothetical protein